MCCGGGSEFGRDVYVRMRLTKETCGPLVVASRRVPHSFDIISVGDTITGWPLQELLIGAWRGRRDVCVAFY